MCHLKLAQLAGPGEDAQIRVNEQKSQHFEKGQMEINKMEMWESWNREERNNGERVCAECDAVTLSVMRAVGCSGNRIWRCHHYNIISPLSLDL